MAQLNKKKPGRWERLKDAYRLVIMNNETFEEVGSYRLSLLNVYTLISTFVVVVATLVVLAIYLTPIRQTVPGYGKVNESSMLFRLNQEIDQLETELAKLQVYAENFRKMLAQEVPAEPEESAPPPVDFPDSLLNVEPIPEDLLLREEIKSTQLVRQMDQREQNGTGGEKMRPEELFFFPPVDGPVSAGFMPDKKHFGVDVLAPKNTPVKAAMEGFVTFSDWTRETGHTIGIQHDHNLITYYKHNSALLKKAGESVRAGEAIAIIGNTGTMSSGPHLHFEVWFDGKPLDPSAYVKF
jgi:murein DD-endopeptidase MepM/ murein hydrolase activator NlpD